MRGANDGTHIKLIKQNSYELKFYLIWNLYNHHSIFKHGINDTNILFWNLSVLEHEGSHNTIYFWDSFLYKDFFKQLISQKPTIH